KIKKNTFFGVLFLAILIMLGACDPSDSLPDAPLPPKIAESAAAQIQQEQLKTFAYNCLINGYVVTDLGKSKDGMWLFLSGKTILLPKSKSASGSSYSNGELSFWSKANEAILTTPEGQDHCVESRKASIIEDAKLRGVDYRGQGHEPDWTLEISGSEMIFVNDHGQNRYSFLIEEHQVEGESRNVVYTASDPTNKISTRILGKTCSDNMSGELLETGVEIILNGQLYRGCGQGLH
ncbi:MAG: MliC family protein, partial [Gammaproteobacteria bacterium]|nr:MliC family protein [Gammaproteobacteria bacterium]